MEENLREAAEALVLLSCWQFWCLLSCGYYSSACCLLRINCIHCDHRYQKIIFSCTNVIALCSYLIFLICLCIEFMIPHTFTGSVLQIVASTICNFIGMYTVYTNLYGHA